jgi:hypothetical protein
MPFSFLHSGIHLSFVGKLIVHLAAGFFYKNIGFVSGRVSPTTTGTSFS